MEQPQIVDEQGQERDWDWLVANFGDVRLERVQVPPGLNLAYRLVRLQDAVGPAILNVDVADAGGTRLPGIRVVRYWPDAPALPDWPPPTSRWQERGVWGETKPEGPVGFGLGHGDYYFAPHGGASAVWVAAPDAPSDMVQGLGMLGGTEHRHLDVYFQIQGDEPPAPEPPTPEPPTSEPPPEPPAPEPPAEEQVTALLRRLDRIIALLESRQG